MRIVLITAFCAALAVGLWPSAPAPTYRTFLDKGPLQLVPSDKWVYRESSTHVGDEAIRVLSTGSGAYSQYWEVQYRGKHRWEIVRYEVRLGLVINKDIILKEFHGITG